jgi:hypothetical protein
MRVCLYTECHVHSEQFEQECHLCAQFRVYLREVLDVGLPQVLLRVMLEERAQFNIFVVVVLHEFRVTDEMGELGVIGDEDLSGAIDMVTYPEFGVVLLICGLVELRTLGEGGD